MKRHACIVHAHNALPPLRPSHAPLPEPRSSHSTANDLAGDYGLGTASQIGAKRIIPECSQRPSLVFAKSGFCPHFPSFDSTSVARQAVLETRIDRGCMLLGGADGGSTHRFSRSRRSCASGLDFMSGMVTSEVNDDLDIFQDRNLGIESDGERMH